MNAKLLIHAVVKFSAGALLLGGLLFGFAGTLAYPNACLFLQLLFIPTLLLVAALFVKAPHLLEKRLQHKEKNASQARIVALSGLLFIAVFALCGLDFRFGWSRMPAPLTAAAAILQLFAYGLYAEVMRENAFLSRAIELQENQHVVDTGLYGFVRHPMYAATILLFLAMPLVLGSYVAFAAMLLYPACIVRRIREEEAFLLYNLKGYDAYVRRVLWRLIPFVW